MNTGDLNDIFPVTTPPPPDGRQTNNLTLPVDISKALGFFVNRGAPTALMHLCCVGPNVLHAASLWALRISTCRAREGVKREVKGN